MYQLIYVSDFAKTLDEQDMQNILSNARQCNEASGISGKLVAVTGHFYQIIEGEKEHVCAVFEKIQRDWRHTNVRIVTTKDTSVREFGDWSMGFSLLLEAQQKGDAATILTNFAQRDIFAREHQQGIHMLLKQVC
ncbi:BLUF domain-containing protein [Paraglaciecola sp. L1A13]|uniref:BLUF domain-containing protein n=1 Tax=Paraglaciecola sp. L1A13 TaxID=2686359 RepID=UPI00131ACA56|nr:BLUF domain-containing protein [Paraglaciecola sp. L1A13]